jgi:xylulokinase
MLYIGLDVGTSSLKTLVMDQSHHVIFRKSIAYQYEQDEQGNRQMDPTIWLDAALTSLHEFFPKTSADQEATIACTGQMHTTVFLDDEGKAIYPAILWNDLRTKSLIPYLKQKFAEKEETKYAQRIVSPGSFASNMLWMHENEREVWKKIAHIMTPYAYLVQCLTGQYAMDYCDASTSSLYDIVRKEWSVHACRTCYVDPSLLAPIYPSCHIVGDVLPDIAEKIGAAQPLHVIIGTGDNPANAVSLGMNQHPDPVISLGTSGVVLIPKKDQDFEGKGKNVLLSLYGEDFINIVQGTVRSAGGSHRWWMENVLKLPLDTNMDAITPDRMGKNSVLFFPHITGDKLIYADVDIRGAFLGLSVSTTQLDMTQAVYEGVGFALKEVFENMKLSQMPKRIRINGGGTKSKPWMQIIASILNVPIQIVAQEASPGYGACLMAAMAMHDQVQSEPESAPQVIQPVQDAIVGYQKQYAVYKKIYQGLKAIS